MITRLHCFLFLTCAAIVANAAELKEAKVTQIIHDQTKLGEPDTQAEVEALYKTQL